MGKNLINLVIKNPAENTEYKFFEAVEVLAKALNLHFKVEHSPMNEQSPYQAVRDAEEKLHKRTDELLFKLFRAIAKQWLGVVEKAKEVDPFKLGKIRINPKTGKPLTRAEWNAIRKNLDRALRYVFRDPDELMTRKAIALGKILETMPVEERGSTPYNKIDKTFDLLNQSKDDFLKNILLYAEQNAAELITDLTARSRKKIMQTLIDAERNKKSARQIERQLFEDFADLNKDWRRIAETEHASNVNNGFLMTRLDKNDNKATFLRGVTMGNACSWCESHVSEKVVALLPAPPAGGGDKVTIEGKEYTAIWPGKSNVGRSRSDWWVAAGTQHPHCRCSWVDYIPGFDEYNERLMKEIRNG